MSQPEMLVDFDGTKRWYLNGKLHREDGPAVEWPNGSKYWYLNDKLHREDGPAVELPDGTKRWCLNNQYHREGGPAIEWANGTKEWYLNGEEVTWQQVFKQAKTEEQQVRVLISALTTS